MRPMSPASFLKIKESFWSHDQALEGAITPNHAKS